MSSVCWYSVHLLSVICLARIKPETIVSPSYSSCPSFCTYSCESIQPKPTDVPAQHLTCVGLTWKKLVSLFSWNFVELTTHLSMSTTSAQVLRSQQHRLLCQESGYYQAGVSAKRGTADSCAGFECLDQTLSIRYFLWNYCTRNIVLSFHDNFCLDSCYLVYLFVFYEQAYEFHSPHTNTHGLSIVGRPLFYCSSAWGSVLTAGGCCVLQH